MNSNLKDKIYGCIFGGAIGDALGLGTEFMSVPEIRVRYRNGLTDYSQIVRDAHRSQWERGEYSCDTDMQLVIADTIAAEKRINYKSFARALKDWYDTDPIDVPSPVRWVLSQPDYTDRPIEVSERVWRLIGNYRASNESLERAVLCAVWEKNPEQSVIETCRITHPDSRCVCCSAIVAHAASAVICEERVPGPEEIMDIAYRLDRRACKYVELAQEDSLEPMELDDEETCWFTRKGMGCTLWALWHCDSSEEALQKIIMAGGDADTNAALAMSIIGLKNGFDSLPDNLVQGLKKRDYIEEVADRFYKVVENEYSYRK